MANKDVTKNPNFFDHLHSKLMLPLQHLACIEVAKRLWSLLNLETTRPKKFPKTGFCYVFQVKHQIVVLIEVILLEKVAALKLPPSLSEVLVMFLEIIGFQLIFWRSYHLTTDLLTEEIADRHLTQLTWTPYGTVDDTKTALRLVLDKDIPVFYRYRLACTYCFEDEIRSLWKLLDNKERASTKELMCFDKCGCIEFWSYLMDDDLSHFLDVYTPDYPLIADLDPFVYIFLHAIRHGKEAAVKYFWHKVNEDTRCSLLVDCAKDATFVYKQLEGEYNYKTNVLRFLLSHMDQVQTHYFFKTEICSVFCSFLHWPWDKKFVHVAEHLKIYQSLIDHIFCSTSIFKRDLLKNYWHLCPPKLRKAVQNGEDGFLECMMRIDIECVKYVYEDNPSVEEKATIAYAISNVFYYLKWEELDVLIRQLDFCEKELFFLRRLVSGRDKRPSTIDTHKKFILLIECLIKERKEESE